MKDDELFQYEEQTDSDFFKRYSEVEINRINELSSCFDRVSYNKWLQEIEDSKKRLKAIERDKKINDILDGRQS